MTLPLCLGGGAITVTSCFRNSLSMVRNALNTGLLDEHGLAILNTSKE